MMLTSFRFLLGLFLIFIASNMNAQDSPIPGYAISWSDEFDGTEVDSSKWHVRYPGPRSNAYNDASALTVSDGTLKIKAFRNDTGAVITGMIGTQDTYLTAYGYFECRVKFQQKGGSSSAFWLQSPKLGDGVGDSRKYGAEIDIYEFRYMKNNRLNFTLHWDGYKEHHKRDGYRYRSTDLMNGWQTVGCLWTKDSYTFYVNGMAIWSSSEGVSSTDQYIILSFEIHDWGGDITKIELPDVVEYDYVRVYKPIE